MKHDTKRGLSRKALAIGLSVFGATALVSSGVAAWVVTANAQKTAQGNVNVAVVRSQAITITVDGLAEGNTLPASDDIHFQPKSGDTTGRVRWDGTNAENLKFTLKGTYSPASYVSAFTIRLDLLDSSGKVDSEAETRFQTAAGSTKNYITLPDCFGKEVAMGSSNLTVGSETDTKNFSYDVAFGWGTAFGGKNPGNYYDEDVTGKTVSDADVASTLADFYKTLTGAADATNASDQTLKYQITLTAKTSA